MPCRRPSTRWLTKCAHNWQVFAFWDVALSLFTLSGSSRRACPCARTAHPAARDPRWWAFGVFNSLALLPPTRTFASDALGHPAFILLRGAARAPTSSTAGHADTDFPARLTSSRISPTDENTIARYDASIACAPAAIGLPTFDTYRYVSETTMYSVTFC